MKYIPPISETNVDPQAGYIDENLAAGIEGSCVPANAIEHPMREIMHCIEQAGLTPDETDLTQLLQSINILISRYDNYKICEFYSWRNPAGYPGFLPAYGALIENADEKYPQAWDFLQTQEGQALCVTEAEWQAMTQATFATLANGTKIGWDGIGGAPFYVQDLATGSLRLPDLRGMYEEAYGFNSLEVGGVHGDGVRNTQGLAGFTVYMSATLGVASGFSSASGVFRAMGQTTNLSYVATQSGYQQTNRFVDFDMSRVTPVSNVVAPRAWGALVCVYLGVK